MDKALCSVPVVVRAGQTFCALLSLSGGLARSYLRVIRQHVRQFGWRFFVCLARGWWPEMHIPRRTSRYQATRGQQDMQCQHFIQHCQRVLQNLDAHQGRGLCIAVFAMPCCTHSRSIGREAPT